jgi:hypothetical protein
MPMAVSQAVSRANHTTYPRSFDAMPALARDRVPHTVVPSLDSIQRGLFLREVPINFPFSGMGHGFCAVPFVVPPQV